MISEGSCDTEDFSITGINYILIFKFLIKIKSCCFKLEVIFQNSNVVSFNCIVLLSFC